MPKLNSNTLLAWLAADKAGTLTTDEAVTLYQYLIDNYIVWGMGRAYTEMAEFLILTGYCLLPEKEREAFGVPVPTCELHRTIELWEKVDGNNRLVQYRGEGK